MYCVYAGRVSIVIVLKLLLNIQEEAHWEWPAWYLEWPALLGCQ